MASPPASRVRQDVRRCQRGQETRHVRALADTHKRSHAIAAVAAGTGERLGEQTIQVGNRGFELQQHGPHCATPARPDNKQIGALLVERVYQHFGRRSQLVGSVVRSRRLMDARRRIVTSRLLGEAAIRR